MSEAVFDPKMLEALICPQTQGPLRYDAENQELVSKAAQLALSNSAHDWKISQSVGVGV